MKTFIDLTEDSSDEEYYDVEECIYAEEDNGMPFHLEYDKLTSLELHRIANQGSEEWKKIFKREGGEKCVYFVVPGDKDGPIKIGYTLGKAEKRVKQYQIGNHLKLNIWCTINVDDPKKWESVIQFFFRKKRIDKSEWFDIKKSEVDMFFSDENIKDALIKDKSDIIKEISKQN